MIKIGTFQRENGKWIATLPDGRFEIQNIHELPDLPLRRQIGLVRGDIGIGAFSYNADNQDEQFATYIPDDKLMNSGGVQLSPSDLVVILEAARIALADGDIFEGIADQMDLSDEELQRVRENLKEQMEATR